MKISSLVLLSVCFLVSVSFTNIEAQNPETFLQCVISSSERVSRIIYTPKNSSFTSTFLSGIQNVRFFSPSMPTPSFIVTPSSESEIQTVISCSKSNNFLVRVRSGGHDYEGLSYAAKVPFVIIDLGNLSSITIDVEEGTAWIGGGVRLGDLYYHVSNKSRNLGFPGANCPTVGVGGLLSGGGINMMLRKYGLAADNILDARIITADGKILDRKSMGDDLFWAIRGGGAASFGVITAWKIRLVEVPDIVTAFTIGRTLEQNATDLVYRWQEIAHELDRDLYLRVLISRVNNSNGKPTIQATFNSLFLGNTDSLVALLQKRFPELGLVKKDCKEMSWIESVIYFADLPKGSTAEDLLRKDPYPKPYYKAKSDYVATPIPKHGLEGLWRHLYEDEARDALLIFGPSGGRVSEISESEIPYPHRGAYIYDIQQLVYWDEKGNKEADKYINWIRRLYSYLTPFVSKNPRAAYLNYRDLDLGVNNVGNTSYGQARVWGIKYFNNNFERLFLVKSKVDPSNFFRNEQSIPVYIY
ncbi:hypothetical protein ACS0TY_035778 [Phlomoides rotata]